MRPIGRYAAWPKPPATRPRPSIGSGRRSVCSRIVARPSSSPPIHFLSRRCGPSSGSISTRPSGPWCCASMKRAKFKPLIERNLFCQCGRGRRRTHDDKRHGTTSLLAALEIAPGKVIGRCFKPHRAKEFLTFLREIDANVPDDLEVHLVMDNYAAHQTPAIRKRLAKRPHWHVHFTPAGASWLNQVERLFALLTEQQLRRGVHRSTPELEQASQKLPRRRQCRSQALPLDKIRRSDPRKQQTLLLQGHASR